MIYHWGLSWLHPLLLLLPHELPLHPAFPPALLALLNQADHGEDAHNWEDDFSPAAFPAVVAAVPFPMFLLIEVFVVL